MTRSSIALGTSHFLYFIICALAKRFTFNTNSAILDCVNPCCYVSELRRGMSHLLRLDEKLFVALVARTTEEGSRRLVYAAICRKRSNEALSNADERELHGAYISLSEIRNPEILLQGRSPTEQATRVYRERAST
jgi:hypothetical protein